MASGSPEIRLQQVRLDTWKAIAQHLGRSARTVQRWHSAYGLPVHHLSGESGSVYAYSDELDRWLKMRGRDGNMEVTLAPDIQSSNASIDYGTSNAFNDLWGSALVSIQARTRSSQLVFLAAKLWETLSHSNLPAILHYYREAIDLSPGNAEAYAGLSLGLIAQGIWGLARLPVAYRSASAALEHAAIVDSQLPLAKCAEAWLKMLSTRDWQGARSGFEEVLTPAHSCTLGIDGRGLLYIAEGCLKKASELFLEADKRRPLSSASMALHCWSEYLAGEFEYTRHQINETRTTGRSGPVLDAVEALAAIQQEDGEANLDRIEALAAEFPLHEVLQGALGHACAVKGQDQRAREILEALINRAKARMSHEPYAIALILIGLGDRQQAVGYLEQSYRNGSLWSLGFRSDPILKPLRDDPYYDQFLARVSYPEPENADAHDQNHCILP
jgi:hypothetical protein